MTLIGLWLQGPALLLKVFHYHTKAQADQYTNVRRLFQHSKISSRTYTLAQFRAPGVIYARATLVQSFHKYVYIRSSHAAMTKRESTHNRKYKQLTQAQNSAS